MANAVYLRGNCQLHSGLSYVKIPGLVFRMKHKNSIQIFLVFSFMEEMLVIQFRSMKKMPVIIFHSMEKMLIMLISWYFLVDEIV